MNNYTHLRHRISGYLCIALVTITIGWLQPVIAESPVVPIDLAIQHYKDGKYAQALTELEALHAANPDLSTSGEDILYFLASSHFKLEHYAQAIALIEPIPTEVREAARFMALLGRVYLAKSKQLPETLDDTVVISNKSAQTALQYFQAAVNSSSDHALKLAYQSELANAQLVLNDPDSAAETAISALVNRSPLSAKDAKLNAFLNDYGMGLEIELGRVIARVWQRANTHDQRRLQNRIIEAFSNDSNLLYNLGKIFVKGWSVYPDPKAALYWYSQAAAANNADAQYLIGAMYYNGYAVAEDYTEAMRWLQKAASQNQAAAQNAIGTLYQHGKGVPQDYPQAMLWYQKAAAQDYPSAQFNIGQLYLNGFGVDQDYTQAFNWYHKAALNGDADSQRNVGLLYQTGLGVSKDYNKAMEWYQKAAKQDDPVALLKIGELYQEGSGVDQDYQKAMHWFRKSAAKNNKQAQFNIGFLYENGYGISQNYNKARKWYQKAADQGHTNAQVNLGLLYHKGLGVTQDYAAAMNWYRQAANEGSTLAQTLIGTLYQNGQGVEQNYAQAMHWYQLAADQDSATAQNFIGMLYEYGLGVTADSKQAISWYRKAAAQDNILGQLNLGVKLALDHRDQIIPEEARTQLTQVTAKQDELDSSQLAKLATGWWWSGDLTQAQTIHVIGLQKDPDNLDLVVNDLELALIQKDLTRFHTRLTKALTLVQPGAEEYSIVRFYSWLANPQQQEYVQLWQAIEQGPAESTAVWDFWSTQRTILTNLEPTHKHQAELFIDYFNAKLTQSDLKSALTKVQAPEPQPDQTTTPPDPEPVSPNPSQQQLEMQPTQVQIQQNQAPVIQPSVSTASKPENNAVPKSQEDSVPADTTVKDPK